MCNSELTFEDHNGNLVVIMPNVIEQMLNHRQLTNDSNEAAGVLIGERRGKHLVIWDLSEPGLGDIRSRHAVDRRGPHHQRTVDEAFSRSGGTLQYLGEWHTHPEVTPSPSMKDLTTWIKNIHGSDEMLLIIVGIEHIWVAKKYLTRIKNLVQI